MDKNDIRNALTLGFVVAVALWSANKGYEVGFEKGRKFERMTSDYAEKLKEKFARKENEKRS